MKIKINQRILSIPPYISTSWKNIASLHLEHSEDGVMLIVTLLNGVGIEIPQLSGELIEAVFAAHVRFMESEEKSSKIPVKHPLSLNLPQEQMISFGFPLKEVLGTDQMGAVLQHNPEQSDGPDLPKEMLARVSEMAKSLGNEEINAIPKPEPHCNCLHCQITAALHRGILEESIAEPEEIVSDEDLKFRTWDVSQTGEKLFLVTNASDQEEHYSVFLGEPIGCTCGQKHCEHVRAVLNS